jgi:hypothetical protein
VPVIRSCIPTRSSPTRPPPTDATPRTTGAPSTHQRTAGFLYQAALRKNLTETLGVDWEPVRNGAAEISGIDDDVLKHFSRRSQEIRERLGQFGARSGRAAEVAALETRRAKDYNVPAERLREEWRARAADRATQRPSSGRRQRHPRRSCRCRHGARGASRSVSPTVLSAPSPPRTSTMAGSTTPTR